MKKINRAHIENLIQNNEEQDFIFIHPKCEYSNKLRKPLADSNSLAIYLSIESYRQLVLDFEIEHIPTLKRIKEGGYTQHLGYDTILKILEA